MECCCLSSVAIAVVSIILFTWLLRKLKVGNYGDKYVFISGCDSGFGYMTARKLDKMGFNVIAACLTEAGMKDVKEGTSSRLTAVQLQITDDASIAKVADQVASILPDGKGLWAMINNAGVVGASGPAEWLSRKDIDFVVNVNCVGHVMMVKALLPHVRRGRGRVVNTASVMGRVCIPFLVPYNISKYAMEAFSDCLRKEMGIWGVSVSTVEPGFFKTGMTDPQKAMDEYARIFSTLQPAIRKDYGVDFMNEMQRRIPEFLDKLTSPKVELVMEAYVHAVTSRFPKTRYMVGGDALAFWRPLSLLPDWVQDKVMLALNKELPKPAAMK